MLRVRLTVLPTIEESFRLRFHFCSKPAAVCLQDEAVGSTQLDNRIPPFPRRLARSYCMANATVKKLHTSKPMPGDPDSSPTYGAYVKAHTHTQSYGTFAYPASFGGMGMANFCAELACTCMSQLLVGQYPASAES